MSQIEKEGDEKEENSGGEEQTKEMEEEKNINRQLDESDSEQPEKITEEEKAASQLKVKPTPDAVKQEPPPVDTAASKNKFEEDCKRWKMSLIRFTQMSGATPINDEDFLVNRERYNVQRDCGNCFLKDTDNLSHPKIIDDLDFFQNLPPVITRSSISAEKRASIRCARSRR